MGQPAHRKTFQVILPRPHDTMCDMVMMDVIYDVVSGILGTVFGVCMTLLATSGRTKRTEALLTDTQKKLDALADENLRLIGALRDKENQILELEKKILQYDNKTIKPKAKKRGK